MRPSTASNNSSSSSSSSGMGDGGNFRSSRSPIPYLFGGLALMMALIAVALLMLACSYRKRPSSTSDDSVGDEEKLAAATKTTVDSEPKILVIMAGHSNPTCLAKPLSSTTHIAQQPV